MSITEPLSEKDPVKFSGYTNFLCQVRNGHLSNSWVAWREVYMTYKSFKNAGEKFPLARTSEKLDMPSNTILGIVRRFE